MLVKYIYIFLTLFNLNIHIYGKMYENWVCSFLFHRFSFHLLHFFLLCIEQFHYVLLLYVCVCLWKCSYLIYFIPVNCVHRVGGVANGVFFVCSGVGWQKFKNWETKTYNTTFYTFSFSKVSEKKTSVYSLYFCYIICKMHV